MALKRYEWRGYTWQFEDGDVPEGAKPVDEKAAKPVNKAAQPANKARQTRAKKAE